MNGALVDRLQLAKPSARRFALPTQSAFLSQAILLEEAGPPKVPETVCLLGFVFVAIAVLASILIQIDVVSSSKGRIETVLSNQLLQSYDGGIVDRVDVEEGQIVEAGDLLITLKDPDGEAQLDRLALRESALSAQVERLKMLVELPRTAQARRSGEAEAIALEQMSILPLETAALESEKRLALAEIERRSTALGNARELEGDASRRVSLIQEKLSADRRLHANGLLSKSLLLEIEQEAIDAITDLSEVQGQIREAEASLAEANLRLANVTTSRHQRQGDQLSSVLIDLNDARQQIKAMRERLERTKIKAAARGLVMELKVRHRGQLVEPGDPVIEIIPIDGGLSAEVRLAPSEISHVHTGQSARIAIDGIEPHRHGYLEGKVETISPSTFVDENMAPYYRVSIGLAEDHLNGLPLTPGMTIQAQVKTGERTILEYLLKPVYRAWSSAFRER